jgi:drug/metabolite transporter (DMT)-like permease
MSPLTLGYLLALLTAVCWAILAIILKKSLEFADAGVIASLRLLFAAAGLALYLGLRKPSQLKILKDLPPLGCIAAILLAFNYFGFTKGVQLISASHAQVMIQLGPLLLLLAGVFFFGEKLGRKELIGISIAGFGYFLFYEQQLVSIAKDTQGIFNLGNIWLVLAAATWAGFASLQKLLFKKYTPVQLNLLIYLIAGLCLLPLGNLKVIAQFATYEWVLILSLALNTIIAYGAFAEALNRIPAGHLSLIITLNPILTLAIIQFAMKFNFSWVPSEPILPMAMLGAIFVITGVAITVTRKNRLKS